MAARTVAPPSDCVHASADITVFDAGGILTAPWDGGRGTVVVAARYSYTGELFSLLQNDTVLRYGDYQVRVDHPLGRGQATLFAFGALDDVGFTNLAANSEYGSLQFHRLDLRWRRALGGGRLLLGATAGADWSSSTLFGSLISVRALSAAPRLIYTHPLGRAVDLEVGGNANLQTFTTDVPNFQRKQSDLGTRAPGALAGDVGDDDLPGGGSPIRLPRLAHRSVRRAGDHRVLRRTAPRRSPPRRERAHAPGRRGPLRADAQPPGQRPRVRGVRAGRSRRADLGRWVAGAEVQLPAHLSLSVTGFYQKLRLTDVRNIDIENNDPTAPDFLVTRDGRAYGAELLLRRADLGRFYGWLAYTLSWSERYDDNGVLGRSDWDERHILNVVAGMRFRGGYSLGGRFHLNTGRWAPVVNSPGGDYQQLPTYYQLDLRGERRFVFDRFVMDVYADFANVTLDPEVLQLDYVYTSTPGGNMIDQDVVKLILPTIGLHAQF